MNKIYFTLSLFLIATSSTLIGQKVVELAAFNTKVSLSYFKDITNIKYTKDSNDIHRYRVYTTNLDSIMLIAKSNGLNPRIIDLDQMRADCKCKSDEPITTARVSNIFFEFGSKSLRPYPKHKLDFLVGLMFEYPNYKISFKGHTDSIGSDLINDKLALDRVNVVSNYLISKGVAPERIKGEGFGKRRPIARNTQVSGTDSPDGRKFNRRVEVSIFDGNNNLLNMVEDIVVPEHLKCLTREQFIEKINE